MEALTSHKQDAPREMRKTNDTTFDRIYKFYFNRKTTVALNDEEEAIRERWDFAWKILANMYTKRQAVDALIAKFPGIKKSIAYDDVNKAMMLFGDPRQANQEAKKSLSEEWITKGIKKAWDDGDLDAYERLIGRYNKLNKLEQDKESELPDFIKNRKPTQLILSISAEDLRGAAESLRAAIEQERSEQERTVDTDFTLE